MPDDTVKHLEFIQAVVGRLGNNGFLVRGWAITVTGLYFGFAVQSDDWRLGLVSVIPIVAFWGIDAYFLRSERLFRELYAAVVGGSGDTPPFYMAATSEDFRSRCEPDVSSYWRTALRRPVLWGFYGSLLVSAGLVVALIVITPAASDDGEGNGRTATESPPAAA
jgi:hypothetical protein